MHLSPTQWEIQFCFTSEISTSLRCCPARHTAAPVWVLPKVEDAFTAIGYNQVWGEVAVILGGIPEQLAILLVAAQTLGESTLLRSSNEDTTMKHDAYPAYLRKNHLENHQSSAEEKTTDVHPWDLQNYRVFLQVSNAIIETWLGSPRRMFVISSGSLPASKPQPLQNG